MEEWCIDSNFKLEAFCCLLYMLTKKGWDVMLKESGGSEVYHVDIKFGNDVLDVDIREPETKVFLGSIAVDEWSVANNT